MTDPGSLPSPDPRPPARAARIARIGIVTVVLVLSLWYALSGLEWDEFREALSSAHFLWIGAAIAAALAAHLVRALRWRLLLPEGNRTSVLNAFSATIIGYTMNNAIPRSGELIRPFVLARREKRPFSSVMASVIVERILDGFTLATITVLLIFVERGRIEQLLPGYDASDILLTLVVPLVALLIVLGIALRTSLGDRLLDRLGRRLSPERTAKLRGLLHDFRRGVTLGGPRGTIAIVLWTIPLWLCYGATIYFSFLAFGMTGPHGLGIGAATVVLAVTTIAYTIAPTPGAIGVYHSFCRAALVTVYGVPHSRAAAFALVAHGGPYLAVIAVGALFALRENLSLGDAARASLAGDVLASDEENPSNPGNSGPSRP
jgi:glycosyltransferase 2 family protein